MKITLNGKMYETQSFNLHTLLEELELANAVVATALNGEFVCIEQRSEALFNNGDRIEVLAPMQGG